MKKEVILVPKDKCPLDVLSEMGERIRNSWIFLHENVYHQLLKSEGVTYSLFSIPNDKDGININLNGKGIICNPPESNGWATVTRMAFHPYYGERPKDPEDIYFLKMDE